MNKERKELAVGDTAQAALLALKESGRVFSEKKHEIILDEGTGLHSIYRRRRPRDRTVRRPIRREGKEPYASYGPDKRPIVLTLHPGEIIGARLKGRRRERLITWHDLYAYLARCEANARLADRKKKRDDKRKARLTSRKRGKR